MRAPERLEDVGAARQAGGRAVAVLGQRAAGAGGDQRRGGRDVEGRAPAAGARGVDEVVALARHRRGERAHRARQAGELVDRLPLRAQPDQERGDLRLGGLAGHDLGQHRRPPAPGPDRGPTRARRWPGSGASRYVKEVLQQRLALVGEDRLGMELDALGGSSRWRMAITTPPPVAETSKQAGSLVDHERVVAPDGQRRRQAAKIVRPSCSIVVVLPWTGRWRMTVPPKACASDWWPRQTPEGRHARLAGSGA